MAKAGKRRKPRRWRHETEQALKGELELRRVVSPTLPSPEAILRLGGAMTLLFLAVWFLLAGSSKKDAPRPSEASALTSVLQELHHAANPDERAGLLARASLDGDTVMPQLVAFLMEPANPLSADAVGLASSFNAPELLFPLRQLANTGPPDLRAAAMAAAERIEPWNDAELATWFDSTVPAMVIAAIKVGSTRPAKPFLRLLQLLEHKNAAVREAALAALPAPLPDRLARMELERARSLAGMPNVQILRALGRESENGDVELWLTSLLGAAESDNLVLLDTLALKRGALYEPDAVLALIRDPNRGVLERAAGIFCLERTHTLERVGDLLDLARGDPVLDHAVGRCLLCQLDLRAFPRLLAVLEADSSRAPAKAFATAQREARALLGEQSGNGPDAALDVLRTWVGVAKEVHPLSLAPSAIDLHPASPSR